MEKEDSYGLEKGKLFNKEAELLNWGVPYYHNEDKNCNHLGFGYLYYSVVRSLRPEVVVCIGSAFGFVPMLLAYGCQDNNKGKCYFVDPSKFPISWWKLGEEFMICRFQEVGIKKEFIKPYLMTNKKFNKVFDEEIDVLFIDGGEDPVNVDFDFYTIGGKVKKNGIIMIHDIDHSDTKPGQYGIHFYRKELVSKLNKDKYEVLRFMGSGGIALIRKLF